MLILVLDFATMECEDEDEHEEDCGLIFVDRPPCILCSAFNVMERYQNRTSETQTSNRSNNMKLTILTGCVIAGLCVFTTGVKAASYSDNFNDGNDTGWSHYPSTAIGLGLSWTFPVVSGSDLGYKLISNAGTSSANPGRVGSFYGSIITADFYVQADLLDWTSTWGQYMGVLGRHVSQGSTVFPTGYGLILRNDSTGPGAQSALQITKLDSFGSTVLTGGQGFFNVTGASAAPAPSGDYRLEFWSIGGSTLFGKAFDIINNQYLIFNNGSGGLTDIISARDSTYASGDTGLMGFVRTAEGVDPTYDNFFMTNEVPEPSTLALAGMGIASLVIFRRRK